MDAEPLVRLSAAELARVSTLDELQALGRARMLPAVEQYVAGGSWDEVTLAENVAAFRRLRFRSRILSGVTGAALATEVLGRAAAVPLGIAPMAQFGYCHPDGELPAARAAAAAGWIFVLSTLSTRSIEAVAEVGRAAGAGPRWFQLYLQQDMAFSRSLVERAAATGYEALVVTVDLPILGYRRSDLRSAGIRESLGNWPGGGGPGTPARRGHPPLTWDLIDEVRSWTRLPLVLKGILVGEDATLGADHGATGLVVSNHGGRQLDRAPATIDVLDEVIQAVSGRAEVYLDGGIRRGLDVAIALAKGARAVFVGRPVLYGLAAGGEAGVARALEIVERETERAMILLGAASVGELSPRMLLAPDR